MKKDYKNLNVFQNTLFFTKRCNDVGASLFFNTKFLIKFCFIVLLSSYSYSQTTIAIQNFETSPATPTMSFTNTLGTIGLITPGSPAGATTVFAGTRGFYFTGSVVGPAVFTSNADVDTRCYSNPSLTFRLAALASNGAQGLDVADIVTIAISTNGGTSFTNEMQIKGFSNAVWSYTGGTASAASGYDGNGTVEAGKVFGPTAGGVRTTDGYSTVTLTGLPKTGNLRVKITLLNDAGNETWAIDNVVVNNATVAAIPTTPTFTAVAPICSGGSLSALPTTSNNGITGTWSPALSNTATNTYTFTPTAGLCATTTTLTITVNPNVTPTFTAVAPICSGGSLSALPTTSNNGITGTWLPALNNLATTTYTFTPTSGLCATTAMLTITVIPNVTYYRDFDTDGFGDLTNTQISCTGAPIGYVANSTDCNDTNILIYQSALLYADVDGDGYNVGSAVTCYGATLPAGTSLTTLGSGDCNDNNIAIYQTGLFYVDADGDNYATSNTTSLVCYGASEPNGYSAVNLGLDCDDTNISIYQTGLFYVDADGDNYATSNTTTLLCYGASEPNGYSILNLGLDCDDTNISIYQTGLFYVDADGDNYATSNTTSLLCYGASEPNGYSILNLGLDCDDTIAAINPGQVEILYNGVDDNCDGNLDEGFQITTPMMGCGTTLVTISSLISAVSSPASGITRHRFEVTKVGSNPLEVQVIERHNQYFSLTQLHHHSYAATYSIRVMLQRNGVWLGYYGPACTISSPAVLDPGGASSVTPSQCGITLPSISTLIATTSLPSATGYKFRVTNTRTGFVQELPRTLQWFSLTMLAQHIYGDTYTVEVAVKTTGDYSGYGSPCDVTAPPVPSLTSLCNTIVAAKSTLIATASLGLVTSYDFEVKNMVTNAVSSVANNLNWFRLNMISNYAASTQFRVRVRLLTSGVYSDYGDACFITSPAVARTIETLVDNNVFEVTASPNPFDNSFGMFLNATNTEDVSIRVCDMIGKLIEQRLVKATEVVSQEVGNNYPSGVYNVIVSQGTSVKTLRMIKR
jgi:Putative metal-binding motif